MTDTKYAQETQPAPSRNRFDRMEWAGAFGDLGTLIPFVVSYIGVLKMDPVGTSIDLRAGGLSNRSNSIDEADSIGCWTA
jgi:hypothetical protein